MTPDKRRLLFDLAVWIGSLVLAFGLLAADAFAERSRVPAENATWRAECGSCHVAYPPALLSATQWRAQMASLERHYGTDASVDAAAAAEIGAFLERNAGRDRGVAVAPAEPPRITDVGVVRQGASQGARAGLDVRRREVRRPTAARATPAPTAATSTSTRCAFPADAKEQST